MWPIRRALNLNCLHLSCLLATRLASDGARTTTTTTTTPSDAAASADASSKSGDANADPSQPQGWLSRILSGPQSNPDGFYHRSHSVMLADSDSIYELQSTFSGASMLGATLGVYSA